MKKTALILAFIMLVLSMSISASALSQTISVDNINFNSPKSSLSLSGKIDGAKTNTYVLMKIYSSETDALIASDAVYTVGENFTFDNVVLPEIQQSTPCEIVITSLYNTESYNTETLENEDSAFYYPAKADAIAVINEMSNKTASVIDGILRTDIKSKHLGFSEYSDVYNKTTSEDIALYDVKSKTLATDTESWENLLATLKKGTYAALLHDTNSADEVKSIVENEELSTLLELSLENEDGSFNAYAALSNEAKSKFYGMLLSAKYKSPAELPNVFRSMAAVSYLRDGNYENIPTVFASVSDLMGRDIKYSDYNDLDPSDKTKVLKSTADYAKKVSDIESVIEHFEKEAKDKNSDDDDDDSSSGSFGGGPVGGGIAILTPSISQGEKPITKITYTDVSEAFWAETAILYLTEKGIINGMGDGRFAPNNNITRGQICKIAAVAFGLKLGEIPVSFTDVPENSWYKQYVDILSSNGIINGYGGGAFNPEGAVTREELAVILNRILAFKNEKPIKVREFKGFNDSDTINDYALQDIKDMYEYGILNGDGENVRPKSLATRAETAQLVYLMLGE